MTLIIFDQGDKKIDNGFLLIEHEAIEFYMQMVINIKLIDKVQCVLLLCNQIRTDIYDPRRFPQVHQQMLQV